MPEVYPFDRLMPATERWLLRGRTIAGGVNLLGEGRLGRNDGGGIWTCWMTDIALDTPEQMRIARGLEARLQGGLTSIIVPACDEGAGSPARSGGWQADYAVATAAALRATELDVEFTVGRPLKDGWKFSIDHPTVGKRLYMISEVDAADGGEQTIRFVPPLREAVTDEALDFNDPGCLMRLANPDDFIGPLDALHESTANAVWVEYF